ncbi:T9SS type A sorting domain-containing protein [Foetidibacter luteolus]|uniref:T9SS type A sorting domain-containing protein n=1 Tax=Foetidibacter luteolus TaxID=2608880 RepID=UPI001A993544|nr:T9SS type A sorting domain-containing protein [Foetidibacter luteolus]
MKLTLYKLLGTLAFIVAGNITTEAQDGTPDATFGANGQVITDVAGVADYGAAIAVQTGGKIVLGGHTTIASKNYFALVRYQPDGAIDSTFGTNGKTIAGFDGNNLLSLSAIKLQQDSKIIALGYLNTGGVVLMRFTADGVVDSSFGTGGRVLTDNINGEETICYDLAVQSDGGIIAVGNAGCDVAMFCYKPNGTPDSTFGVNGIKVIDAGGCDKASAIAIQPDKKIVMAGICQEGALGHFLVLRCNINGSLDSTFGTNGKTINDIRQYNAAYSCILQPDGKIVAGGLAKFISLASFGIARYMPNGTLDSSFGTNGSTYVQLPGTNYPKSVALQKDDKIIFSGTTNNGGAFSIDVLRYNSNGVIDSTFGIDGLAGTVIGSVTFGNALVMQDDDKILVGGYSSFTSTGNDFVAVRFNNSIVLPVKLTSFTGVAVKRAIELNWMTASEVSSSHFIIEKRGSANSFNAIGRVNSSGNSSQVRQYSYLDVKPVSGDNFYRLKLVDKDGKFMYSKIVTVAFGNEPFIIAYPNPARWAVKLGGLTAGNLLYLVDMSGKVVNQYTANGSNYTINIQHLKAGLYVIRVMRMGKLTTLKIVKE